MGGCPSASGLPWNAHSMSSHCGTRPRRRLGSEVDAALLAELESEVSVLGSGTSAVTTCQVLFRQLAVAFRAARREYRSSSCSRNRASFVRYFVAASRSLRAFWCSASLGK